MKNAEKHTNDRRIDLKPNASADWRAEYRAQAVDADLRADGGRYILPTVGGRVRDREDGDELVVVDTYPGANADKYGIDDLDGVTVADVNDTYDPSAPVVDAVYVEDLEETLDGWRAVEDVKDAVSFDAITAYSFPADRLAAANGGGSE